MNENVKIVIALCVVGFLILGPGTYGLAMLSANNGNENFLTEFWGFDVEQIQKELEDANDDDDDDDDEEVTEVPVKLDIYKRGVETTDPDPAAYIWYDWDEDGLVDIGDYGTGAGEIETGSASSGTLTTNEYYPAGSWIYIQLVKSGYETVTYRKKVPTPSDSWDGTTALSLGSVWMIAEETDSTDRVRVNAQGSSGAVLMVTSTTDYNYTTNGATATLTISITCATSDMGIATLDYTDWATGNDYKGSFIAMAVTNADNSDITLNAEFNDVKTDGTYYWYIFDLPTIFNDADVDDDGLYQLSFSVTMTAAWDIAYLNVFSSLKMTTYNAGSLSTGYVMQETNLDFTA